MAPASLVSRVPLLAIPCVLLFHLVCAAPTAAQPLRTRNVFIVNIDGIRNQEAFESGALNMPFLWDSLRPLGTIYTNFQNRGITVTNSGHSTIVTGVRQMLPNNSGIPTPVRPQEPTLGEYCRASLGTPQRLVHFISGKTSIWRYPVSLFPGYGYAVAPTVTLTSSKDTITWDSTRAIMDREHPTLAYLLFAQVDAEGHTADSVKYFGAIRRVDSLIFLLWTKIQADTVYRDRTTMIVTSDHGRHDDLHGGWQGHGDYCHGCRHIPFLAIGPDIRTGEECVLPRDHIDIAPTVAHLLGFSAPLSQGEIMGEMLLIPPSSAGGSTRAVPGEVPVSNGSLPSRSPSLAVQGGAVHVVYSAGPAGGRHVLHTVSTDHGSTWTAPQPLFSGAGTEYIETAIIPFGLNGLYAAAAGVRFFDAESSYAWILAGKRSTDGGVTWDSPVVIDTLGTISTKPSLASAGDLIALTAMVGYRVWNYVSSDGGLTFAGQRAHTASCTTPANALMGTTPWCAWRHLHADSLPYWNVLSDRSPWRPNTDHPVTANDTNSYSYLPSLCSDGDSTLHLVYAHLADASAGNGWSILYRNKRGSGDLWGPAQEIAPGRTGWSPVIRRAPTGDLHAVWADLDGGSWSIVSCVSTDDGATWEDPVPRTYPQSFSLNPAVAVAGDSVYVVWEDWRGGRPQVFFALYAVFETRVIPQSSGWTLFGLPVDPADRSVQGLFACDSLCPVYTYTAGGYVRVDTLYPGRAYWAKSVTLDSGVVRGRPISGLSVSLAEGWNLVSGPSDTTAVSSLATDPPGILRSVFFGFEESGYVASSQLLPGRGYWVRSAAPGTLTLQGTKGRR